MSKPVRMPFIPGPGLTGLACAIGATVAIVQMQLLDGAAGRLFAAALVLLLYMVFCFVIFVAHRRKQQAASAWQNSGADQAGDASQEVLIAFASQTGFAEQIAQQTAQALKDAGMQVRACSLAQLDLVQLQAVRRVLFVVSTTGEGDAPDSAAGFARKVMGPAAVLQDLHYGVLALGDRSYAQYCAFGHALDAWLRRHGAHALFDMVEVDNGDTGALRHWQHHLGVLSGHTDMADWSAPGYERWSLTERQLLNPGSAGGAAFHLAFKPVDAQQTLSWQAGDIAEIGPRNDPARVSALLDALQLDGSAPVHDGALDETATLGDVLARSLLPHDAAELASLRGMTAQALADGCKPLPHREYSIASLPQDGQLELLVRQTLLPDGTLGLGSGWLTAHLAGQGQLDLRVRPNRGFHPPADDCPLILIGNGTGLAGLRAHMKARIALGRRRNWLLFGERSVQHDFFHRDEIRRWQAQGMLERLDLAFSRDQAQRIYVQDRLREAAHLLQQWVDDGAAIYVCGSLEGMAGGVAQALGAILGEDVLESMAEQGRYRRDVY
ncbi:flavodoxin domain-containing protein [Herbaspirillum rhizosphaerae]|uniref:flavodoxin domain-containing protein n=1 Tax=Herbaspirillum rhizosphaerae TaxID=346179 RepID=UPI0009FA099B|nr:sulfite reductase flavoprotein subunit alpha [Herbaspirillum rhizosphaerae]